MNKTIAVIIPCYNEEKHIAKCLDGLIANDYPKELLDIIVVDGMSRDNTRNIVSEYSGKYPFIRILDNPDKLKPIALNLGIKNSESDIVIRIDAHAEYEKQYISKLVDGLEKYHADNIGGVRKTYLGKTSWSKSVGTMISHPFAIGNSYWRMGSDKPRRVDTVFCGCYRREVFDKIGLFNEKLVRTQDKEFNARLTRSNGVIILDPAVECLYYPRVNFIHYLKWTYNGPFWLFLADAYTDIRMKSWKNYIPLCFVLYHLVFLSFLFNIFLLIFLLVPIVLYYFLVILFSLLVTLKQKDIGCFFSCLILFPATHYAYGLGSICGKIKGLFTKREVKEWSLRN
jgi:glycosyltransferase involved in cell wall biosynthesis